METTTLGGTGINVGRLGFGAAPIGFLKTEQEHADTLLNWLLDNGVNLIDTAAMYDDSERLLGAAIGHRRDESVLVSKCGTRASDLDGAPWSRQLIAATVDRALRRLRTDHLDVMLLHTCEKQVLETGEALGALVEARDAGKVRCVGYSGDNEAAAYAATLEDVAVIETSVNICDQANIRSVLPICRDRGLGVIAKRPIADAAWRDTKDLDGVYLDYTRTYARRLDLMRISPYSLGYTDHQEIEWPEIALRFTLSQPGVHTAIVGTRSLDNARANVLAARKGDLPEEAVNRLGDAFRSAEADAGETWPGQT